MKQKIFLYLRLLTLSACILITVFIHPIPGRTTEPTDNNKQQYRPHFSVLACIAWWSHDAVGYHPAMFLMLDNTSGQDITGEEIPFQARFTDLRDGSITVARDYKRAPVHNHERLVLLLRAPKSFELPIDSALWPTMECKAMCRLPDKDSNDPQVDDLFMTHLTRITMSDEDAHAQLVAQAERNPLLVQRETDQEKPTNHTSQEIKNKTVAKSTPNAASNGGMDRARTLPKRLPKVGDDFYVFDQLYGAAHEFQSGIRSNTDDLTWAHYCARFPLFDVYAGSRNASKVDVLMITLSATCVPKESNLLNLAKLLAGCPKNAPIGPFAHSVRYLHTGRSEIMTTAIRDRRILSFRLQNSDNSDSNSLNKVAIFVTRLSGDPEAALSNYVKCVGFLHVSD